MEYLVKYKSTISKIINRLYLPALIVIITFISTFPYLKPGLAGYMPDLQYHLARIEGVRLAILAGHYPTKIYEFFYNGYGYGSPMFYPDIFLVIPAFIRIIGFDPIATYKISVCIFTILLVVITYYSFCYITKNQFYSFVGTGLICLSQFYLADLQNRVGFSEYIAFVFLPLLFVAIYDLFVFEGKKIYLLGVSLSCLLLCHTIMFFLSFCFTFAVFAALLFVKEYRAKFIKNIRPFILCIIGSFGATAFYTLPMAEQHFWGSFFYQKPWAHVGDYVETLRIILFTMKGYFNVIAYVGIGIPILISIVICALPIIFGKGNKNLCSFFFIIGLVQFILMTDLFPWKYLNKTVFNMIQFTYRIYPLALMSVILGMILYLSKFELQKKTLAIYAFGLFLFAVSCFFGLIQNSYVSNNEDSLIFTEQYLIENATVTGSSEWAPRAFHGKLNDFKSPTDVIDENKNAYSFSHPSYGKYFFDVTDESVTSYSAPLFCYKGYKAFLIDEKNERTPLPVSSVSGKVNIQNTAHKKGTIHVEYVGTAIQVISNICTIFTLIILALGVVKRLKSHVSSGSAKEV